MAAISTNQVTAVVATIVAQAPELAVIPSVVINAQTRQFLNGLEAEATNQNTLSAEQALQASVVKKIAGH